MNIKKLFTNLLTRDNLIIEVKNEETGKIKIIKTHNLVVTTGKNLLRDFLYDGSSVTVAGLTHFGYGTGTTAAAAADTALETQVARDTITQKIKDTGKLTVKYYLSSANGNGSTLTEVGLFNAASSGTMYARAIHAAIAKTSSISVTYSWELTWTV